MTISNESVEAAAKILIEDGRWGVPWEDASDDDRTDAMERARMILESAAPYIRAQALEDAAKDAEYDLDLMDEPKENAPSSWLRARAAAERGGE